MNILRLLKMNGFLCFCLALAFVAVAFSYAKFSSQEVALAADENFIEETASDDVFTMKMTAKSRKSTILLRKEETCINSVGDEATYLVFDWSELEYLKFTFSANLSSGVDYVDYSFSVSYIRAETLYPSMSTSTQTPLTSNEIGSSFSQFDFTFYIDSTSSSSVGTYAARGNDFGLYKFNFTYSYEDNTTVYKSLKEIYVAVMPDDVEEVFKSVSGMAVVYTVSSSNKLMNVYNLQLSTDAFAYCNPDYFVWEVTGNDQNNYYYCLDTEMQKDPDYQNYETIWQSDYENTGTAFTLDTNDIEGTWDVKLTIYNSSGTAIGTYFASNLSTIKTEQVSYLWLIVLIILLVIFIVAAVLTVILLSHKRKEKVW